MMLLLPTFNAKLNSCPVSPAEFTPHAQGSFCGTCQRLVQDFSQSESPLAELAAARTASPDGRVCGTFRREQVAAPPTLTRRLKWFLLALVLVVGHGLTAPEALAQVRRAAPHTQALKKHKPTARKKPAEQLEVPETLSLIGELPLPEVYESETLVKTGNHVYTYAEQMPELPGGGGVAKIVAHIQQQVKWPKGTERLDVEGRVYVSFIVGKDGLVRDAKLLKGLHPLLDAEALRVVQSLTGFTPGRQGGQPVAVSLAVPVTFRRE